MNPINIQMPTDEIAVLHMNDSENKNSFTNEFIENIMEKINVLNKNTNIKVIILRGLKNIFSSGASESNLLELSRGEFSVKDLVLSEAILNIPVPVIAAMEGGALGGGLVLGLCCDIIIMAERSMYGVNFTNYGFTPGMGCTRLLESLVGPYIAREMMFTGKIYKGKVFKNKGLVNEILPQDEVFEKALQTAEIIAERPRKTLEILKYSLNLNKQKMLIEARVHEDLMHKISFAQPEVANMIKTIYHRFKNDQKNQ